MHLAKRKPISSLAVLTSTLCLAASAYAQQAVTEPALHARDLGTIGGQRARALTIGATGLVAGTDVEATSGRRPVRFFVVPPGEPLRNLGEWASPSDVNEHGTVVGTSYSSTRSRAFHWTPADGLVELPFTPGGRRDQGVGIDRLGRIAVNGGAAPQRVFIWNPRDSGYTELPTLRGLEGVANGVSPSGAVVGLARAVEDRGPDEATLVREVPVLWEAASGNLHELPVLKEADGTRWYGEATDVNDAGTIVGTLWNGERVHAVAWTGPDHVLQDLGSGRALALNANDLAAGAIPHPQPGDAEFPRSVPVLWDLRRGTTIRLQGFAAAPGDVVDGEATDVDDRGVAVGWLETASGPLESHAVAFDRYAPAP